jgi:hypothetical protein
MIHYTGGRRVKGDSCIETRETKGRKVKRL